MYEAQKNKLIHIDYMYQASTKGFGIIYSIIPYKRKERETNNKERERGSSLDPMNSRTRAGQAEAFGSFPTLYSKGTPTSIHLNS